MGFTDIERVLGWIERMKPHAVRVYALADEDETALRQALGVTTHLH